MLPEQVSYLHLSWIVFFWCKQGQVAKLNVVAVRVGLREQLCVQTIISEVCASRPVCALPCLSSSQTDRVGVRSRGTVCYSLLVYEQCWALLKCKRGKRKGARVTMWTSKWDLASKEKSGKGVTGNLGIVTAIVWSIWWHIYLKRLKSVEI